MKSREWLLLIVVAVVLFVAVGRGPAERADRPFLNMLARVAKWLVIIFVADAPPESSGNYEAQPHVLVNAPPMRATGNDGVQVIDHGSAW
jgi:hypothetical protein